MDIPRKSIDIALEKIEAIDKYPEKCNAYLQELIQLQPALYQHISNIVRQSKHEQTITNYTIYFYCFLMDLLKRENVSVYILSEQDVNNYKNDFIKTFLSSAMKSHDPKQNTDGLQTLVNALLSMEGPTQNLVHIFLSECNVIDLSLQKNKEALMPMLMNWILIAFSINKAIEEQKNKQYN